MDKQRDLGDRVRKYLEYFFGEPGLRDLSPKASLSPSVQETVRAVRGPDTGSAIMLHGIMPRSGTVYVGELLRLHPDIYAYPHQLWEFPALQLAGTVVKLQEKFLSGYWPNSKRLKDNDFLPLFGLSMLAWLAQSMPPRHRVLVKMPGVHHLDAFFLMFPYESLLILVRDGRDLVHSSLRTWPRLNFLQVCLQWNRCARKILQSCERFREDNKPFLLVRYEDILSAPEEFVRKFCRTYDFKENRYPFGRIPKIRVIGSSKLEGDEDVRWRHLKAPHDFKPVAYWKDWSAVRKLVFKTVAGRSLNDLGYSHNSEW